MADPYRNFKFVVDCDGFPRAGFAKIGGLTETTEDITYREGGENETPHHLSGQTTYGDLTFERGMSSDEDFLNWRDEIFSVDRVEGSQGDNESYRKTIVIHLRDKSGANVHTWTVKRAWPKEMSTEDLDANGNGVLIQSMVFANEGIKQKKS